MVSWAHAALHSCMNAHTRKAHPETQHTYVVYSFCSAGCRPCTHFMRGPLNSGPALAGAAPTSAPAADAAANAAAAPGAATVLSRARWLRRSVAACGLSNSAGGQSCHRSASCTNRHHSSASCNSGQASSRQQHVWDSSTREAGMHACKQAGSSMCRAAASREA